MGSDERGPGHSGAVWVVTTESVSAPAGKQGLQGAATPPSPAKAQDSEGGGAGGSWGHPLAHPFPEFIEDVTGQGASRIQKQSVPQRQAGQRRRPRNPEAQAPNFSPTGLGLSRASGPGGLGGRCRAWQPPLGHRNVASVSRAQTSFLNMVPRAQSSRFYGLSYRWFQGTWRQTVPYGGVCLRSRVPEGQGPGRATSGFAGPDAWAAFVKKNNTIYKIRRRCEKWILIWNDEGNHIKPRISQHPEKKWLFG